MRGLLFGLAPVLGTVILLLVSMQIMSAAIENATSFNRLYSLLLLVNVLGIVGLGILIAVNFWRLLKQLRDKVPGARLTARMLLMFIVLAVTPVLVVYFFSVQFLHRGIDSWFNVQVEEALGDALALSRSALDSRMRELSKQTLLAVDELAMHSDEPMAVLLGELRERSGATAMTVIGRSGRILASSHVDPTNIVPDKPDEAVLSQVRSSRRYVSLEPLDRGGVQVRIVETLPQLTSDEVLLLQALYPVTERDSRLADNVDSAYTEYKELSYLRNPLKTSFILTLSLVLLLSVLTSAWAAFFSARRLAAPIQDLAEGTRAVAAGDYETRLAPMGRDDMAFLVRSFNDMTRRLSAARNEARSSQEAVENQRAYLETVLARLSSGVITFDEDHRLDTSNKAASQILMVDLENCLGMGIWEIAGHFPHLGAVLEVLENNMRNTMEDWRAEVPMFGPAGRQVLLCRGATVLNEKDHVFVFDDVTKLIQAQRDAAWSEVARRLAHEIKNPLTPIQLSAERLRHKYLNTLDGDARETLDRLTHTIVAQVEAMKEMVNAFSNYARSPTMDAQQIDLNVLVKEVLDLYRYDQDKVRIRADLGAELPPLRADVGRLRQVLHNLIKNALEAEGEQVPRLVELRTRCVQDAASKQIDLKVCDNGGGFAEDSISNVFEPYVTSKRKGSGLGLAIVKKIVEEHGGMVRAENGEAGGALISIRFPVATESACSSNSST